MNMTRNPWLPFVTVVALLGGCATPGGGEDGMARTGAKNHVYTTQIDSMVNPKKDEGNLPEKAKNPDTTEKFKLYPGTGAFVKPAPSPMPREDGLGDEIVLNFDGADLREVVKIVLVDIMRESYVIDPKVQGVVNIHSSHPIKRSALVPTLEAVLRMNGASLVREADGVFHVNPFATATKGALTPQVGGINKQLPPGYSVQIIPLKYISAREMVKILEPFTPEGGIVRVDDTRNILFLGGNARELRHLMETIDIFDVDWIAGMSVGLFTLKSVDVKTAFTELEKLFGDKAQGPLAGILRIIPVERLNALLVITPQPKYLEQAKVWVERLDRSGVASGGQQLYVYQVQNGNAMKMATLLGQAFGKGSGQSASAPAEVAPSLKPAEISSPTQGIGSQPPGGQQAASGPSTMTVSAGGATKIIADKDNNALLILASPSEYEVIEAAIRKLDVIPRQVLIEVTIAEITLSDEFSFGLEWYFNNNAKGNGFLDTGAAGIKQLSPGFSYAWLDPAGSIKAVLNALAANSKLNIISSPHIMVSDNRTAKIQVGDRVPTVSQTQALATAITTTATTGVISSIQYLDTGVMLSVTPHINAGGLITMEISQEVSNAVKTVTSGIDSPTISKRSAQSTVTVQAGETMVLGGLINDKKSNANSGLPLLSEIPLLGALFGAQNIKDDRTELVMMITPKLVSNNQEAKEITNEFRLKVNSIMLQRTKNEYHWAKDQREKR